jgi:hypothetical protein
MSQDQQRATLPAIWELIAFGPLAEWGYAGRPHQLSAEPPAGLLLDPLV